MARSRLGWTLIKLALALFIPGVFAVLYLAYSFSLGSSVQNFWMNLIVFAEAALFVLGIMLVLAARFLKPSRAKP
jgi:hypothetical protein